MNINRELLFSKCNRMEEFEIEKEDECFEDIFTVNNEKEIDMSTDLKDKIEEPKPGMIFDSMEELYEYYKMYGNKTRFQVIKRTARKGYDGELEYICLTCASGGHENLSFTEQDYRNLVKKRRQLRLGDGDVAALQKYFLKMHHDNSNFFYTIDIDEEGRLKNVLWVDARSRATFKEFGDVVTFDTTYLTNRYDMPFAPFVGVNHHRQSTLLGCGLISNEDTETFIWLFKNWKTCMFDCAPKAIITDQDKAMQKGIEVVFPEA
ncbi:hypothetical protein Q3G72_000155 [Acer saccharum]|nr:hypothetical protein Q3G72_000155 [Acer saccharum]